MQVFVRTLLLFSLWFLLARPAACLTPSTINLPGRGPNYGSPAIAEIDGNSSNGKEIAIAGVDGGVYVLASSGDLLWSAQTPNAGCGSANNRVNSSPSIGELYGDGVPYVVVSYGGVAQRSCDGGVAVYRGRDGALTWNFSLKAWGKRAKFGESFHAVFATPALKDTDGDGRMEIGFGAFDRRVYLLNADGSVRWFYQAADTVWSSPSFYDIDGDGKDEMIFATDISRNTRLKPATPNGGYLYAFKTASRKGKQIPFRTGQLWLAKLDQVPWSSPVVAEVLPDNPGAEIIIGSGYYFPNQKGRQFKIFSALTGKLLSSLAVSTPSSTSVAVADLNGDGLKEVVATVSGATQYGGDGNGEVVAWTPALGSDPIWKIVPRDRGSDAPFYFASPLIAGLDANGSEEVVVSVANGVVVLDGVTGEQLSCADAGCDDGAPSFPASGGLAAAPAIGDLDGDGKPELVAAVQVSRGQGSHGAVMIWKNIPDLSSSNINGASYRASWPQARANANRSGAAF